MFAYRVGVQPVSREELLQIGPRLREACRVIADARAHPTQLSRGLVVRAELLESLAAIARALEPQAAGDPVAASLAEAARIAALLAAEADFADAQRAARRGHRSGNPVAGLLSS